MAGVTQIQWIWYDSKQGLLHQRITRQHELNKQETWIGIEWNHVETRQVVVSVSWLNIIRRLAAVSIWIVTQHVAVVITIYAC